MLNALGIEIGVEDEGKDDKIFDGKAMRERYLDGWSTDFDWRFRVVVAEFKLQRCLVRDPEKDIGVFAGTWWDLSDEQRAAAEVMGYSNDPDTVRLPPLLYTYII